MRWEATVKLTPAIGRVVSPPLWLPAVASMGRISCRVRKIVCSDAQTADNYSFVRCAVRLGIERGGE
jgi:hypothetical protein